MLLGIEQFGNCEKPVVKNRQRVDGHLPTSAAAIHPRLRHFGDNDLWFIRRWPILRVSGSVEMHKMCLCNHSGLCHVDREFKEKKRMWVYSGTNIKMCTVGYSGTNIKMCTVVQRYKCVGLRKDQRVGKINAKEQHNANKLSQPEAIFGQRNRTIARSLRASYIVFVV